VKADSVVVSVLIETADIADVAIACIVLFGRIAECPFVEMSNRLPVEFILGSKLPIDLADVAAVDIADSTEPSCLPNSGLGLSH
jgi:hypothetical protein